MENELIWWGINFITASQWVRFPGDLSVGDQVVLDAALAKNSIFVPLQNWVHNRIPFRDGSMGLLRLLILLPLVARRLKSSRFKEAASNPDAAARHTAAAPTPYTNGIPCRAAGGFANGAAPRRTAISPATVAGRHGHHSDEHLPRLGKPQAKREPTEA